MTVYGCHNREPFRDRVYYPVRWGAYLDSREFRMATDCQYTLTELGKKDEKCEGCKWKTQKSN